MWADASSLDIMEYDGVANLLLAIHFTGGMPHDKYCEVKKQWQHPDADATPYPAPPPP